MSRKLVSAALLLGMAAWIFPQDVSRLIDDVQSGRTDEALSFIQNSTNLPETPELFFLQGLLEKDGELAVNYYERIIRSYPESEYVDDAMMKLGEYYYSSGLYVQAANWFRNVADDHPDYPYIKMTAKLLLKSLEIAGENELVREYTNKFMEKMPDLWDNDIQLKSPARGAKYQVRPPAAGKGEFVIQVGAFGKREGADSRAELLNKNGFPARVEQIHSGGKTLNAIFVGNYATREEAEAVKSKIRTELGLDSFIVKK